MLHGECLVKLYSVKLKIKPKERHPLMSNLFFPCKGFCGWWQIKLLRLGWENDYFFT